MKSHVFLLTAFSSLVALMRGDPAIADPPPVCPIVQCSPPEFLVQEKAYGCPKKTPINIPVEAAIECLPRNRYSFTCTAFPVEIYTPTCGGSGINLMYDWTVRVGNVNYPYPPSYDNKVSVSCMPRENVSVNLTVWNGTSSSTSNVVMRCGDSAL